MFRIFIYAQELAVERKWTKRTAVYGRLLGTRSKWQRVQRGRNEFNLISIVRWQMEMLSDSY